MITNMTKVLTIAAIGSLIPAAAMAATASNTFQVKVNVVSSCSVSASDLDFVSYDTLSGTPNDASTTVGVICNSGTGYTVKLNGGSVNSSISARQMASGANRLGYQLYTATGRTVIWGDGTTGSTVAGTGSGSSQSLTVFGRIPAGQSAVTGAYADTMTVSVDY